MAQGGGLYPRLLQAIVQTERCWIIHAQENLPSGAGMQKAGFQAVEQISFQRDNSLGLVSIGPPKRARIGAALQIIANIGTLYNRLQHSDKKELLRQVVERVIVNDNGNVTLELRAPFDYLQTLAGDIQRVDVRLGKSRKRRRIATKNGEKVSPAVSPEQSSNHLQSVSTAWIRTRDPSVNSRLLCR
jgi:hypothetical protein